MRLARAALAILLRRQRWPSVAALKGGMPTLRFRVAFISSMSGLPPRRTSVSRMQTSVSRMQLTSRMRSIRFTKLNALAGATSCTNAHANSAFPMPPSPLMTRAYRLQPVAFHSATPGPTPSASTKECRPYSGEVTRVPRPTDRAAPVRLSIRHFGRALARPHICCLAHGLQQIPTISTRTGLASNPLARPPCPRGPADLGVHLRDLDSAGWANSQIKKLRQYRCALARPRVRWPGRPAPSDRGSADLGAHWRDLDSAGSTSPPQNKKHRRYRRVLARPRIRWLGGPIRQRRRGSRRQLAPAVDEKTAQGKIVKTDPTLRFRFCRFLIIEIKKRPKS